MVARSLNFERNTNKQTGDQISSQPSNHRQKPRSLSSRTSSQETTVVILPPPTPRPPPPRRLSPRGRPFFARARYITIGGRARPARTSTALSRYGRVPPPFVPLFRDARPLTAMTADRPVVWVVGVFGKMGGPGAIRWVDAEGEQWGCCAGRAGAGVVFERRSRGLCWRNGRRFKLGKVFGVSWSEKVQKQVNRYCENSNCTTFVFILIENEIVFFEQQQIFSKYFT